MTKAQSAADVMEEMMVLGMWFFCPLFFFLLSFKSHSYSYIVKGRDACSKQKRKQMKERERWLKSVTWSSFFPIVLHHKSRSSLWSVYMLTPSQKENKACVLFIFKHIFLQLFSLLQKKMRLSHNLSCKNVLFIS